MASSRLSSSATIPNTNHAMSFPSHQATATEEKQVQYRQLVSRATTQRLHSASLDNLTKLQDCVISATTVEAWELRERAIARGKTKAALRNLGITWGNVSRFSRSIFFSRRFVAD